jgi:hypothetical protein
LSRIGKLPIELPSGVEVRVEGKGGFVATLDLSPRERKVVMAGGVLNQLRDQEEQGKAPTAEAGS